MKVKIKVAGTGVLVLVGVLTAAWLASHGYTTFAQPYCTDGAANATTASQVVAAVTAKEDVCVTADITAPVVLEAVQGDSVSGEGDIAAGSTTVTNVSGSFTVGMRLIGAGLVDQYRPRSTRVTAVDGDTLTISPAAASDGTGVSLTGADDIQIGSAGDGRLGYIEVDTMGWLTVHARFESTRVDDSNWLWIDNSIAGGSQDDRTFDQIIFMPSATNDAIISNNDIGWTLSDNGGNTGYGCRCYGDLDRLCICGNKFHDITGDAINGVGPGEDMVIDRNEIGPVGPNPDSEEHSDNIQVTGHGPNLRITNNYIHGNGYFFDDVLGDRNSNAGATYIHGKDSENTDTLLYENNLLRNNRGRMEICGLGTPDPPGVQTYLTMRNNTIVDAGQARDDFGFFQGFEWDCDSPTTGSNNLVERNISVDVDGGFAQDGDPATATFTDNLFGVPTLVTLDADGNCTSTNCNPSGEDPIGYRKPSGVNW